MSGAETTRTRRKWALAAVLVTIVACGCVVLGLWQLGRLDERKTSNSAASARMAIEPVELSFLDTTVTEDARYRRVYVIGVFDPSQEVLIRSQVHLGSAGFHVVTPLVLSDGTALLVNRGWVPLVEERVPVAIAPPPDGLVTITGWIEMGQQRPAFGPQDPDSGSLAAMSRIDIERIGHQSTYELLPFYVVEMGERSESLPVRVEEPSFDEEGPHLAYAIQWFSFAAMAVVGFTALYMKARRGQKARSSITS